MVEKTETNINVGKIIVWTIIVLFALSFLFGSFYTVSPGERAIVLRLGAPAADPSLPGLHFKAPIIDSVVYMDVQTQKYETIATAASKDLQNVKTKLAVNYHLVDTQVIAVYKNLGQAYGDKVISPAIQEIVKASTAQFTAEELITNRSRVKDIIDAALSDRLRNYNIILETTSLTDFDFSDQFNAAIEAKVTAQQNALTAQNKLAQVEYEAKQLVASQNATAVATYLNGKAQADVVLAQQNATAQGKLLNAQAEATALALQRAQITPELLQLRQIEVAKAYADHWNGQLPTTVLGNQAQLLQIPSSILNGANK